ncbi:MAG: BamA/TamA family outer membrane protein, partial [Gammaproteobacteria bacterium]|nr:BamA/TamA family outer membrane protein [Gammaproteobacteria bacterium]
IYGWRGANLNNILEFERDYPKVNVVRLEQNYRSTQRILRVAASLIAHNVQRKEKGLFTENDPGAPVRLATYATQKDEAQGIASRIFDEIRAGRRRPGDFAVFYRVNALSRSLEFALRELGIPYQMVNGLEFFQRKEIKDVLAYLHLLNNPRDDVALLRVINTPPRGIGKTTIGRLTDHAARGGLSLLEAARESGGISTLGARPAALLTKFVRLFDRLSSATDGPVEEIVGLVISETGYQKRLQESEDEDDLQRLANIEELLTVARDFDERNGGAGRLEAFIEETCLVSDTDAWETEADRVTLMTLHASKGLEFPVVFLTAAEEGLLPHERSRERADQLEEERRLMFVGITRARQELQISMARYRDFRGQRKLTIPSSFLMELPRDEMELEHPRAESHVEDMWHDIDQRRVPFDDAESGGWQQGVYPNDRNTGETPVPPPASSATQRAPEYVAQRWPRQGPTRLVDSPEGPYVPGPIFDENSPFVGGPPDGGDTLRTLDFEVLAHEAMTGRMMFGVGVNSDAGMVGQIVLDEQNFDWTRFPRGWEDIRNATAFRGAGQRFRLEAVPGTQLQRYMINFQDPYLFGSNINLGLSGYYYNRSYREWFEQRIGGRIALGYQFAPDLSGSIAYRGAKINVTNPIDPTLPDFAEVTGRNLALHGFQVSLARDKRDNAFMATEGHLLEMSIEQVIGSFNYPRAEIDLRKYFTLYERPDGSGRHVLSL